MRSPVGAALATARIGLLSACSFAAAHLVLAGGALAAPAPVQESRGEVVRDRPAVRDDDPVESDSDVDTMYYEYQILQDEVRRLHGVVEELNHRMDRLEREQRERYIELDQRLLELRGGGAATGNEEPGTADAPSDEPPVPVTEREAYNVAIELVNVARPLPESEQRPQYRRALALFQGIIDNYPNGEFTANAFYWRGELHLALKEHEEAREAFAQVDLLYDDHPKVPDALYKLGEVYNMLGDTDRAREYLKRVINDHPTSTAAGLARKYLAEL
ncbi:MAG: tol-pal system protein YbgF, partial [Gammaproteobacteria bacterium]|nr:tol-pal system protein YbgF [Gammaproteobacteria bacterium]